MELSDIKQKSIVGYLESLGYKPRRKGGKTIAFLSPISKERQPSFMVNLNKNTFTDYSSGTSGSIIDLVMAMEHISFSNACKFLSNGEASAIEPYVPTKTIDAPGIEVTRVEEISDKKLIRYFENNRKVTEKVLREYCKQVSFRFPFSEKDPNRVYTAIGFPNHMGGWELRSSWQKVCTAPKSFSKIGGYSNDKAKVDVWEAWVDFLSSVASKDLTRPKYDTYILNGVHQINVVKPFLDGKKIFLYADNDEAADKFVVKSLEGYDVEDMRYKFEFYNDFNDKVKDLSARCPCGGQIPPVRNEQD